MKKNKLTTEGLINKINNYENDVRTYVIYADIIRKDMLNDPAFKSLLYDGKILDITDDKIIVVRHATISEYRELTKCIKKYEDLKYSVNKILPVNLLDMTNNIEYYSDNTDEIKNIKI